MIYDPGPGQSGALPLKKADCVCFQRSQTELQIVLANPDKTSEWRSINGQILEQSVSILFRSLCKC